MKLILVFFSSVKHDEERGVGFNGLRSLFLAYEKPNFRP